MRAAMSLNSLQHVAGRWALITGASAGIGRAFAAALAQRQAHLVLCARDAERLQAVASELRQAGAAEVRVVACDLETAQGVQTLIDQVAAWELEIELLVNNAGFGAAGKFVRMDAERLRSMTHLNCTSLAELSLAYVPAMVRRGHGGVIQIASVAAFVPTPYMALYGATKAYVLHLTLALADELRGSGVRVLALCPGPVPTDFQKRAGYTNVDRGSAGALDADAVVAEALHAYERGRTLCTPGALNRWQSTLSRLSPLTLATRVAGWVLRRSGRDI